VETNVSLSLGLRVFGFGRYGQPERPKAVRVIALSLHCFLNSAFHHYQLAMETWKDYLYPSSPY